MFAFLLIFSSSFLFHPAVSPDVVISQVYGAGGNSGATFRNDFVELFNRSSSAVSLSGWSLQYSSATGASWSKVDLSGNLGPGQYYLIQLASGGTAGTILPSPDATSTIAMAATAGKVALVRTVSLLSGACPQSSNIADLTGYGTTANCFEGSGPTPVPSAARSIIRGNNGCDDSDNNSLDFTSVAPQPRNLASFARPCQSSPPPPPPPPEEPSSKSGGHVLVFPFYSSSSSSPSMENTSISITNSDESHSVTLHLFFILSESNDSADRFLRLTPNQTVSMLASEIDPGVAGSILAVPVDAMTGCPVRFAGVTGTARIKLASQQAGNMNAIALQMVDGPLSACSAKASVECYAPRVIGGSIVSPEDGYRQMLVITRIGGTLEPFIGAVLNDVESAFSFSITSASSQLRAFIDSRFPGTTPGIGSIIPAGRSGWIKLWSQSDGAIVGVILTHNPRASVSISAGRNLHHLSLTRCSISVPVVIPT